MPMPMPTIYPDTRADTPPTTQTPPSRDAAFRERALRRAQETAVELSAELERLLRHGDTRDWRALSQARLLAVLMSQVQLGNEAISGQREVLRAGVGAPGAPGAGAGAARQEMTELQWSILRRIRRVHGRIAVSTLHAALEELEFRREVADRAVAELIGAGYVVREPAPSAGADEMLAITGQGIEAVRAPD